MRLPRFRVRTLMVAVAVVAAGIGSVQTARRWKVLRSRLEFHAAQSARFSRIVAEDSDWVDDFRKHAVDDPQREHTYTSLARLTSHDLAWHRALADYHARLQGKYERAARYPFLPVAPDPSPPARLFPPAGPVHTAAP